ncbi:MAG: clan AA aspartic protease [Bacteroidetes bacterium]|nr:MAG: clan AA aspartic protease [Bacteroidota bacterium]
MGLIYAEIQLINSTDLGLVRRNLLDKEDIKSILVNALVDTDSYMLAINENIQEQLDLPVLEKKIGQLADGSRKEYDVVGPVDIRFKNRQTTVRAIVLPGDAECLLGAIPLEDMDVLIHPLRQELIVNPDHPYIAVTSLK